MAKKELKPAIEDLAFNALLDRIAEARKQGKSMDHTFEMVNEFLARQPADYADSKRDELMQHVKMLQSQAPLLEQLMGIAKSGGDHMKAVGTMMQMYANLRA